MYKFLVNLFWLQNYFSNLIQFFPNLSKAIVESSHFFVTDQQLCLKKKKKNSFCFDMLRQLKIWKVWESKRLLTCSRLEDKGWIHNWQNLSGKANIVQYFTLLRVFASHFEYVSKLLKVIQNSVFFL